MALTQIQSGMIADAAVTTAKIADANITTAKVADANITPAKLSQPLTQGTSQASTSGTSITFTGIPSWAKRVTIMLNGVTSSGATYQSLQLGSGSLATTGYGGVITVTYGTLTQTNNSPASSFYVINQVASTAHSGSVVLVNVTGNTWVMTSIIGAPSTTRNNYASGAVTLSGALDRIAITDPGTFSAGSINILYE